MTLYSPGFVINTVPYINVIIILSYENGLKVGIMETVANDFFIANFFPRVGLRQLELAYSFNAKTDVVLQGCVSPVKKGTCLFD